MPAPFDPIAKFDKQFGKPTSVTGFAAADEKRLGRRLPETLLKLLRRDGFASYSTQLLWTCDPDEWNGPVGPWRPSKKAEVFMRSSFGHFFLWDGQYCWFADAPEAETTFATDDIDWFLGRFLNKPFLDDLGLVPDTARAHKEAGDLAEDEIYMWTPALALGGSKAESTIEKSQAKPGLALLADLTSISIEKI